jgi:hypothetical protein
MMTKAELKQRQLNKTIRHARIDAGERAKLLTAFDALVAAMAEEAVPDGEPEAKPKKAPAKKKKAKK